MASAQLNVHKVAEKVLRSTFCALSGEYELSWVNEYKVSCRFSRSVGIILVDNLKSLSIRQRYHVFFEDSSMIYFKSFVYELAKKNIFPWWFFYKLNYQNWILNFMYY